MPKVYLKIWVLIQAGGGFVVIITLYGSLIMGKNCVHEFISGGGLFCDRIIEV